MGRVYREQTERHERSGEGNDAENQRTEINLAEESDLQI